MPYPTKPTPPAVFLNVTMILAILASIGFAMLYLFADRFGNEPAIVTRLKMLTGSVTAVSLMVAFLAFFGLKWLRS